MSKQSVVGRRVALRSRDGAECGTLRFLGKVKFMQGVWAGIELDEPTGKHDGTVEAVEYFRCAPKHGLFVREDAIQLLPRRTGSEADSAATPEPMKRVRDVYGEVGEHNSKLQHELQMLRNSFSSAPDGHGAGGRSAAAEPDPVSTSMLSTSLLSERDLGGPAEPMNRSGLSMTGSVSNGLMPPEPERPAPSQNTGRRRDGRPPAASRSTKHPPTADRLHHAASYSDEDSLPDFGQTRRHPPARDTTSHGPPHAHPMHINAPQSGPEYGRRRRPTPHPDVVGGDVATASEAPPGSGPPGRAIGLGDIAELPKDGAHAHFRDEPVTAEVPDHRGNYPPPAIRATRSSDRKRRPTPHPNAIPDAPPRRDVINPFSDSDSDTDTADRHGRRQHQQETKASPPSPRQWHEERQALLRERRAAEDAGKQVTSAMVAAQKDAERLRREVRRLEQEAQSREAELQELRIEQDAQSRVRNTEDVRQLKLRVRQAQERSSSLQDKLESAEERADQANRLVQQLQDELVATRQKLQQAQEQSTPDLSTTVRRLTEALAEAREETVQLREEAAKAKRRMSLGSSSSRGSAQKATAKVAALQQELSQLRVDAQQQHDDNEELQCALERAQTRAQQAEQDAELTKDELNRMRAQLSKQDEQMRAMRKALREAQHSQGDKAVDLTQYQADLDNSRAEVADLQKQLQRARELINSSSNATSSTGRQIGQLEATIASERSRAQEAEREVDRLTTTAAIATAAKTRAEEELEESSAAIDNIMSRLRESQQEVANLRAKYTVAARAAAEAESEAEGWRTVAERVESSVREQVSISVLKVEAGLADDTADSASQRRKAKDMRRRADEATMALAEAIGGDVRAEFATLHDEIFDRFEDCVQETEASKAWLEELQQQIMEAERRADDLQSERARLQTELKISESLKVSAERSRDAAKKYARGLEVQLSLASSQKGSPKDSPAGRGLSASSWSDRADSPSSGSPRDSGRHSRPTSHRHHVTRRSRGSGSESTDSVSVEAMVADLQNARRGRKQHSGQSLELPETTITGQSPSKISSEFSTPAPVPAEATSPPVAPEATAQAGSNIRPPETAAAREARLKKEMSRGRAPSEATPDQSDDPPTDPRQESATAAAPAPAPSADPTSDQPAPVPVHPAVPRDIADPVYPRSAPGPESARTSRAQSVDEGGLEPPTASTPETQSTPSTPEQRQTRLSGTGSSSAESSPVPAAVLIEMDSGIAINKKKADLMAQRLLKHEKAKQQRLEAARNRSEAAKAGDSSIIGDSPAPSPIRRRTGKATPKSAAKATPDRTAAPAEATDSPPAGDRAVPRRPQSAARGRPTSATTTPAQRRSRSASRGSREELAAQPDASGKPTVNTRQKPPHAPQAGVAERTPRRNPAGTARRGSRASVASEGTSQGHRPSGASPSNHSAGERNAVTPGPRGGRSARSGAPTARTPARSSSIGRARPAMGKWSGGPKLPVRGLPPKNKANHNRVKSAIEHVCLAGAHQVDKRDAALQALTDMGDEHCLILFTGKGEKRSNFMGLYKLVQGEHPHAQLVHSSSAHVPQLISRKQMASLYKFDTAAREFKEIKAASITLTTDAIAISERSLVDRPRSASRVRRAPDSQDNSAAATPTSSPSHAVAATRQQRGNKPTDTPASDRGTRITRRPNQRPSSARRARPAPTPGPEERSLSRSAVRADDTPPSDSLASTARLGRLPDRMASSESGASAPRPPSRNTVTDEMLASDDFDYFAFGGEEEESDEGEVDHLGRTGRPVGIVPMDEHEPSSAASVHVQRTLAAVNAHRVSSADRSLEDGGHGDEEEDDDTVHFSNAFAQFGDAQHDEPARAQAPVDEKFLRELTYAPSTDSLDGDRAAGRRTGASRGGLGTRSAKSAHGLNGGHGRGISTHSTGSYTEEDLTF